CECKPKPTEQAGPESNLRAGQVKLPQKVLIQTPEARGQELFRQPDIVCCVIRVAIKLATAMVLI
ncbi:hypothetical protein MUP77_07010, partial [Candidatus Bathyarchaeota archaeon]|nr:hypothetical protein [Candidatus Bathyarchaeota archaeon]